MRPEVDWDPECVSLFKHLFWVQVLTSKYALGNMDAFRHEKTIALSYVGEENIVLSHFTGHEKGDGNAIIEAL